MLRSSYNLNLFLALFVLLGSCTSQYEQTKEEKIFFHYLSSAHQLNELRGNNVFFVVPLGSCLGCKKLLFDVYNKHFNNKSFFLLVNSADVFKFGLDTIDNKNILVDKQNNLDRLDIGIQNGSLIFVSDKKITKFLYLNPNNVDSIDFFLNTK